MEASLMMHMDASFPLPSTLSLPIPDPASSNVGISKFQNSEISNCWDGFFQLAQVDRYVRKCSETRSWNSKPAQCTPSRYYLLGKFLPAWKGKESWTWKTHEIENYEKSKIFIFSDLLCCEGFLLLKESKNNTVTRFKHVNTKNQDFDFFIFFEFMSFPCSAFFAFPCRQKLSQQVLPW